MVYLQDSVSESESEELDDEDGEDERVLADFLLVFVLPESTHSLLAVGLP